MPSTSNDEPVDISPRHVLKTRAASSTRNKGWRPVVAPELEFYLVKKNLDPDYPLDAAVGRSGRKEPGGQAYGIDAANDFDPIVEDIYDYCEAQELDVDTLSATRAGRHSSKSTSTTAIRWSLPIRSSCSSAPCARPP